MGREREYETVSEHAERLGLDEQTVYGHIREGRIPVRRLGKRIFVDLGAIRELRQREIDRVAGIGQATGL